MPVQFRDYYETLGVSKTATTDDIRKAFRKLARQYHPDVAKDKKTAEEKFKQINEAYEILGDKDKREKYDRLGSNWQQYEQAGAGTGAGGGGARQGAGRKGAGGGADFDFGGTGYSDFFEQFFSTGSRYGRGAEQQRPGGFDFFPQKEAGRGADVEADISVTMEEALKGSKRSVSLRRADAASDAKVDTYEVKIPAGVHEGQRIRLRSRGEAGRGGGESGDLFLRVRLAPHPEFRVEAGGDLYHDLTVAPWDAVLGAEVTVPTLEGPIKLKVPPGSQVGRRFRLRGRGLPVTAAKRTDLYVQLGVTLPEKLTEKQQGLWEQLAEAERGKAA